jgi:hypothetical protein
VVVAVQRASSLGRIAQSGNRPSQRSRPGGQVGPVRGAAQAGWTADKPRDTDSGPPGLGPGDWVPVIGSRGLGPGDWVPGIGSRGRARGETGWGNGCRTAEQFDPSVTQGIDWMVEQPGSIDSLLHDSFSVSPRDRRARSPLTAERLAPGRLNCQPAWDGSPAVRMRTSAAPVGPLCRGTRPPLAAAAWEQRLRSGGQSTARAELDHSGWS